MIASVMGILQIDIMVDAVRTVSQLLHESLVWAAEGHLTL